MKNYVTVKELPANTYIIREETVEDVALLYVIAGALNVSQKTVDKKEEVIITWSDSLYSYEIMKYDLLNKTNFDTFLLLLELSICSA